MRGSRKEGEDELDDEELGYNQSNPVKPSSESTDT